MTDRKSMEDILNERDEAQEDIKAFEKNVRKGVRKSIYRSSLLMILAVVLVFTGIEKLYRYEQETTSWNPSRLEEILDRSFYQGADVTEEYIANENAFLYIQTYYDLFAPGYRTVKRSLPGFVKRLTYGEYEFSQSVINIFRTNPEGGFSWTGTDSTVVLTNGKLVPNEDMRTRTLRDSFAAWWSMGAEKYEAMYQVPDPRSEVEGLSDSAYVEMDIRFGSAMSVQEVLQLQAAYPKSQILYAVTYADPEIVSEHTLLPNTCGFCMTDSGIKEELSTEASEKYPDLITAQMNDADTCIRHYKSALQLLISSGLLQYPDYVIAEHAYAEAEEKGVSVIGMRMSLTKADAQRIMEEPAVSSFHIADIKMSRFE